MKPHSQIFSADMRNGRATAQPRNPHKQRLVKRNAVAKPSSLRLTRARDTRHARHGNVARLFIGFSPLSVRTLCAQPAESCAQHGRQRR